MKKFLLFVLLTMTSALMTRAENIGVPAECEDVMLQAFYWDSYKLNAKYGTTRWTALKDEADAIAADFDLVWFPPSASSTGGVGYYHAQLTNQNSAWGTQSELINLITALHNKGVKVIGDIVINHRSNKSSWCDFWPDEFPGIYGGTFQLTQEHICRYDECFTDSESSCYGVALSERGAADTGTNDAGCRDLDHKSEYVQNWAKSYLKWMLKRMKYDGFRYDMTRGYHGRYLSMYNEYVKPYFSVSEYWEGIDNTVGHLQATNYNTLIFDFPMKYELCNAIRAGNYRLLYNPSNSLRNRGYRRYAVTFIDNHDTFEREDNQGQEFIGYNIDITLPANKNKILQANAYILMLPGVPCVFYPHWKSFTSQISAMIALRKLAGIHSESDVYESVNNNSYEVITTGHRGTLILRLGANRSLDIPAGYYVALEGGSDGDYTIFASEGTAIDEVESQPTDKCVKFVRDGRMLIRRGNQVFDMTGRIVE